MQSQCSNKNAKNDNSAGMPCYMCGSDGTVYQSLRHLAKEIRVDRDRISRALRDKGFFTHKGIKYAKVNISGGQPQLLDNTEAEVAAEYKENKEEFEQWKQVKNVEELPFEKYEFKFSKKQEGSRYAVALFSDAHIEETVKPNTVLGLNEYNLDIAKKRIENYFVNLVNCLNHDKVEDLIFASLGDIISGYIHEELAQTNGMAPLEAIEVAQGLMYAGLEYICEHTKLRSIKFVGIVGNHGRTTKKIQHANGYKMSYEWLMYRNLKKNCEIKGLPIEFYIPESELAIVETDDNKTFIFCHGFQIKSGGTNTICGIYPALQRLSLRWSKTFHQDRIFLGHFHSCVSIPSAVVNGSVIGYNAFALSNGFEYEVPAQQYIVYQRNMNEILNRRIYCD